MVPRPPPPGASTTRATNSPPGSSASLAAPPPSAPTTALRLTACRFMSETRSLVQVVAAGDDYPVDDHRRPRYRPIGRTIHMERGLYIAAGGMLAEQVRQDQIANDLANASTPGYKPDRAAQASFGDMMLQSSATGRPIGTLSLGVGIDELRTDLTQGPLKQTGNP